MPGDPNECRQHAKRCQELAEDAPSQLAKARFEQLAQTWLRLASDLEQAKALVENWGESKKLTG
jgi:hypothetical protein